MAKAQRVVVIGLDALDRDLVIAWAREGALPTFAALMKDAAWGSIENPRGLVSGSSMPSLYTGVMPGRHGQYGAYDHLVPGTYRDDEIGPEDLTWPPLWDVLSRAGKRVAVIDAPYTFPSKVIRGIQLVDWATHSRLRGATFRTRPDDLAPRIAARFGNDPIGLCDANRPRSIEEFRTFRDRLVDRVRRKTDLCLHLLEQEPWDYFFAVFCDAHCAGHQCWHIHDSTHPRHDPKIAAAVGNPMKDVYVAIDAALARILEHRSPETLMLFVSNIGMGPNYDEAHLLDPILRALEGRPEPKAREATLDVLRRWWVHAPTGVRKALSPVRTKVWTAVDQAVVQSDRASRRYFEMWVNDAAGGIRFNLVGREPKGRVRRGAEYDELCEQLSRDLREIVNADTGVPLVREVMRTDRLYQGERLDKLPDLLAEWNRVGPVRRVTSPKIGTIELKDQEGRTGDHKPLGLFLAAGPGVRPGGLNEAVSITDFSPTLRTILGVPVGETDGRPIDALGASA